MNKFAQMHGEVPYVKMDEKLFNLLGSEFDGSVANVCASVLSGGKNQIGRMAAAFGPKHLNEFYQFLKPLYDSGVQYAGLSELMCITEKAMDVAYEGKERPAAKPKTPDTFEELMNTPMHPDVKDIKANIISRRAIK